MPRTLAVRSADLEAVIDFDTFAGLPREEVARLHGAVEVLQGAGAEPSLPLVALCVAHHNYSWLVHAPGSGPRTLCLASPLTAAGAEPAVFLGERMAAAARELMDGYIANGDYTLRCAGLLREPAARTLDLVYLARLHRRGKDCLAPRVTGVELWGNGELLQRRDQLDARSQILVDHLSAL